MPPPTIWQSSLTRPLRRTTPQPSEYSLLFLERTLHISLNISPFQHWILRLRAGLEGCGHFAGRTFDFLKWGSETIADQIS